VNLPDGSKILVSVGYADIRVVKLGLMNIPTRNIWAFDFGFPIRTSPSTTTNKAQAAMEAILSIVETCQTLSDVERKLSADGMRLSTAAISRTGEVPDAESGKRAKEELVNRMMSGVNMITVGIFSRLLSRFSRTLPQKTAGMLAAAVVNELFFRPPVNQEAAAFLRSNYKQVQEEIANLSGDAEIKNAFTQAIRVNLIISQEQGKISTQEAIGKLEQSMKRGVLLQGGEMPTPEHFLPFAHNFQTAA
jgi:hypothetical protein